MEPIADGSLHLVDEVEQPERIAARLVEAKVRRQRLASEETPPGAREALFRLLRQHRSPRRQRTRHAARLRRIAGVPGPRPVLIDIHGGPESQFRPGFLGRKNYPIDALGIAIVFPNVRGSSGYGKGYLKLDNGRLREDAVKDIGALLDWVATRDDLDAGRVLVTGGSYGGHMTLAVAWYYADRIRCAVDIVGISNFVTFLENTESYRRDLRRYREFLVQQGVERLDDISEATVTSFLVRLREGDGDHPPLSASSAGRTVVAVRGFHRFAVKDGLATADPSAGVRPPTPAKRLPKAIPLGDVERLLEAAGAPGTALALRDRALLEVLYGTGARISEAVGLDVDDLELELPDDEQGTVLLRGKGSKERIVPVGRYARDAVTAYLVRARPALAAKGKGTPALLLGRRGARLTRQSAWLALRDAAARAGLREHISPHTLRHSFATHLLDGGADVRVVQELLGHASVTTTQVYTLVTVDNLREVFATAHPRARE